MYPYTRLLFLVSLQLFSGCIWGPCEVRRANSEQVRVIRYMKYWPRPGDTPESVGAMYATSTELFLEINNLSESDELHSGRYVMIPVDVRYKDGIKVPNSPNSALAYSKELDYDQGY